MSDSNGCIYDKNGIDLDEIKRIKEVERLRIKEYQKKYTGAEYLENTKDSTPKVYTIKADIVLPCATQNDINLETAKILVNNGVIAVGEGANMPTNLEAIEYFLSKFSTVNFCPGLIISWFHQSDLVRITSLSKDEYL